MRFKIYNKKETDMRLYNGVYNGVQTWERFSNKESMELNSEKDESDSEICSFFVSF